MLPRARSISVFLVAGTALLGAVAAAGDNAAKKVLIGDTKVDVVARWQGAALPKPERIVIYDFDVPADVVSVDRSPAARVHLPRHGEQGSDPNSPEGVAEQVRRSFAKSLAHELQAAELPVAAAAQEGAEGAPFNGAQPEDAPPQAGSPQAAPASPAAPGSLVVHGDFTAVKQGNKTKRIFIGFGKGASDVQAHVTVSEVGAEQQPLTLLEFKVQSKSGKKPGAAVTVGAGAATLGTVTAGSAAAGVATGGVLDRAATVEADAARMAKSVAKQILDLLHSQQWSASP